MSSRHAMLPDLPTVIFQIIQDFLPCEDYRSLMDCCRKAFSAIKYETVRYDLKIASADEVCIDERRVAFLYNLINEKVKDKSKQIYIDHRVVSETQLLRYIPCFQGICYLYLNGLNQRSSDFDFNIFDGIRHVKLERFKRIENILSGFENVEVLELESFPRLRSIRNISTATSLEAFTIGDCAVLDCLSFPMDNLHSLSVSSCFQFDPRRILSKIPKLKVLKMELKGNTTETFLNFPVDFSLLTSLDSHCKLPMDYQDFHLFETISDLRLEDFTDELPCFKLSRFMGHRLSLVNFDVTASIEAMTRFPQSFDNLRIAEFDRCEGIVHFPKLQHLRELKVSYCVGLQSIPTLPKLRSLMIHYCDELVSISADQPALKECLLSNCSEITDLSFAAKYMHRLALDRCENVRDISMLGKVKSLAIRHCVEVKSLAGLEGDPFSSEPDQREISLQELSKVEDFTSLHHIGKLILRHLSKLHDCQGIHHIGHLCIVSCNNFTTTAGLGQIDCALEIRQCDTFELSSDIERIPLVLLEGTNSLTKVHYTLPFRTELMRGSYGLEEKWETKRVKLFGLASMMEEMKSQRWVKTIKAILKGVDYEMLLFL